MSNLDREMLHVRLEYALKAVDIGVIAAAHLARHYPERPSLEIRVDGRTIVEGTLAGWANPAIESAAMHARALMEFLGVKLDGTDPTKLATRGRPRSDDFAIENFKAADGSPLAKVLPDQADGGSDEMRRKLAWILHVSNKALAHLTSGLVVNDDGEAHDTQDAFERVLKLVEIAYYEASGLPVPDYRNGRRHRQLDT